MYHTLIPFYKILHKTVVGFVAIFIQIRKQLITNYKLRSG